MIKTVVWIVVGVFIVAGLGGLIFIKGRATKPPTANQANPSTAPNFEVLDTQPTTVVKTCSPPNTPTCDPNSHPVGSATDQTTKNQSTNNQETKKLPIETTSIKLSGAYPEGLDIDPKTGYVYIGNNSTVIAGCAGDVSQPGKDYRQETRETAQNERPGANTLSIVDPASGKEIANNPTETGAIWTQVDRARNVVYVAGSGSGKIAIHNLGSGKKVDTITVGGKPHAFGLNQADGILITSNTKDATQTYLSSIDVKTNKVLEAQKAPELPHGIALDPEKGVAYLVGVKDGTIAVIDMKTGKIMETFSPIKKKTDSPANASNMIAFSSKTRQIFISDAQPTSSITVINVDSRKVVGHIGFSQKSSPAWGMQVDDENGLLYAALPNANAVGIADIKTLKPLGLITVDDCPYAVRLDIVRNMAYATSQTKDVLSVIDLNKVKAALGK